MGAKWEHEDESAGLSAVPPSSLEAKRRRVSLTAFKAVIWPRPRCPRYVPAGARRVHCDAQSRETPSSKPGGSLQGRALHAKLRTAKHWPARRPAVAPAIFNANSARTSKRTSGACCCGSSGVLADGEWHMCGQMCIFAVCSGCVVHCGTPSSMEMLRAGSRALLPLSVEATPPTPSKGCVRSTLSVGSRLHSTLECKPSQPAI